MSRKDECCIFHDRALSSITESPQDASPGEREYTGVWTDMYQNLSQVLPMDSLLDSGTANTQETLPPPDLIQSRP